jgi:hypothetical protein
MRYSLCVAMSFCVRTYIFYDSSLTKYSLAIRVTKELLSQDIDVYCQHDHPRLESVISVSQAQTRQPFAVELSEL